MLKLKILFFLSLAFFSYERSLASSCEEIVKSQTLQRFNDKLLTLKKEQLEILAIHCSLYKPEGCPQTFGVILPFVAGALALGVVPLILAGPGPINHQIEGITTTRSPYGLGERTITGGAVAGYTIYAVALFVSVVFSIIYSSDYIQKYKKIVTRRKSSYLEKLEKIESKITEITTLIAIIESAFAQKFRESVRKPFESFNALLLEHGKDQLDEKSFLEGFKKLVLAGAFHKRETLRATEEGKETERSWFGLFQNLPSLKSLDLLFRKLVKEGFPNNEAVESFLSLIHVPKEVVIH